jgi:hypothetical protein
MTLDRPLEMAAAALAAFVALVLARAALHKAADLVRFEGVLADYRLAPEAALPALRWAIPLAEAACALALAIPASRAAGGLAAAGLLLAYAAAMGINLARGRREIDCGCGGAPEPLGWGLVLRNLAMVAALAPAIGGSGAALGAAGILAAWVPAFFALLAFGAGEQLLANHARMAGDRRSLLASAFGGRP